MDAHKFYKKRQRKFCNVTASTGIDKQAGWWNTISAGDFDNDGDIDYVAGNLGLNSFYKASDQYPVSIYAKDFDNNESFDAYPSFTFQQVSRTGQKRIPRQQRDDAVKQMIGLRNRFPELQILCKCYNRSVV
jgi:hypothetical protein